MTLEDIINISFVCSGNTGRSYIAEAIGKYLLDNNYLKKNKILRNKINIISSGIYVITRSVPRNSYLTLKSIKVPTITSKPTQISHNIIKYSDLVLTMADNHRNAIIKNFNDIDQKKIFTLLELSNIILYLQSERIYRRKPKNYVKKVRELNLEFVKNKIYTLKNINRDVLVTTEELDIIDPHGMDLEDYLGIAKKIKDNIITIFNYLFDNNFT